MAKERTILILLFALLTTKIVLGKVWRVEEEQHLKNPHSEWTEEDEEELDTEDSESEDINLIQLHSESAKNPSKN